MQLQVISQSLGTLHSDQNGFLQLRAEAHCQPVCPRARPVIGWPGVCDEGSASAEDVSCPSCRTQREITQVWQRELDFNQKKKRMTCDWKYKYRKKLKTDFTTKIQISVYHLFLSK